MQWIGETLRFLNKWKKQQNITMVFKICDIYPKNTYKLTRSSNSKTGVRFKLMAWEQKLMFYLTELSGRTLYCNRWWEIPVIKKVEVDNGGVQQHIIIQWKKKKQAKKGRTWNIITKYISINCMESKQQRLIGKWNCKLSTKMHKNDWSEDLFKNLR